ncbi:MAG: putative hydrolase [Paucimonas sp.]|nr:putative hydrolase [Paucimonas sp.]
MPANASQPVALNGSCQVGNGPLRIIVLSGWFGCADAWSPLLDALDTEQASWLFFDYRGYGRSRHLRGDYSFEEVAADVLRLADSLGWDRFALVGHSMGGMAMQRVLLAAPHRVTRMLAVTAVPACGARMDAQRLASFTVAIDELAGRRFIIDYSTGKRLPAAWVERMAQQSWDNSTPAAFGGYLAQWATGDFSAAVAGNPVPVKVMVGEHDPSLNADLMQKTWLAWYPNASLEILPNAGHYPMNEIPVAFAASAQAFLLDQAA